MKSTLLLLSLVVVTPLLAADSTKILLSGTSINVEDMKVSGTAKAVAGDMTVTAEAIAFDSQKNLLRCEGTATIRIFGNVVTGRDCTIELGPGEKKLAFLTWGKIQLAPASNAPFVPTAPTDLIGPRADREKLLQDFQSRR